MSNDHYSPVRPSPPLHGTPGDTEPPDVPKPFPPGGINFEEIPFQLECWEQPPQTDEEWDEALKHYAWDRHSEVSLQPQPRHTRDKGSPLVSPEEYGRHDPNSGSPFDGQCDKPWQQPQPIPTRSDSSPQAATPEEPLDWHWPPPRQPDSLMVSGLPKKGMDNRPIDDPHASPAGMPPQQSSGFGHELLDKERFPRQINSAFEVNNQHSAETERRRMRELYEKQGFLTNATPSPETLNKRAAALRRLGLSADDDDNGARYAVICKYCDLLCMMFDGTRAGITIFRGDVETVHLSHSEKRYFNFPAANALSGHAIMSPDWRCWACPDMEKDWRFKYNPSRIKGTSPRFIAFAPLRYHHPDGDIVDFGALTLIAAEPHRQFGTREQAILLRLSNMLVFQLATLQSEIMSKRSSNMYESSINFLRRSFIPERLRTPPNQNGTSPSEEKHKRRVHKKRYPQTQSRQRSDGGGGPTRLSLQQSSPRLHKSPAEPVSPPTPPPVRATKTGPRDAKRAKRRDLDAEEHLFNDAAQTLRGILQADAVAMVDLHEFQLFVRKTASPSSQTMRSKESIMSDFLQGKNWPSNVEPVVNFVPRYSNQSVTLLGQSSAPGMSFDFSSATAPQVIREFIKRYLTTRHFWWDRQTAGDELAKQVMLFMPNQCLTVLATVFMTYSGSLRYATFAAWTRAPCKFDDSSRLALPFVWIIGAALMSSLAILRVRAIEESQITYSNLQAHELRTPLHQILAITQLLRSSISDFAEAPVVNRDSGLTTLQQVRDLLPLLDAIDTSGTTLHGIVENILTFLDLSAKDNRWGGVPGNPTIVNGTGVPRTLSVMLEELIHDACDEDRRGRIGSGQALGHIETIFEIIPQDLGELVTEDYGGALRRALARVIHNAYRYIEAQGCVEITVDDVKSMLPPEGCEDLANTRRVLITITDNGRGMGPDFVREKLGEPWAKEDLYATGSGLSVHLAYRIIDLMNGEMEITSAPGQGSTVTIEVPLPVSRTLRVSPTALGRKVAIVGFDGGVVDPDCTDYTHLDRLGKSLERQYRKLGCEIVDVDEAEVIIADGGLEEDPSGVAMLASFTAPEIFILAASAEDDKRLATAMSTLSRRVRRLLKPITPSLIVQTLAQTSAPSSVPHTPTEGVMMDGPPRPRLRPHFDQAALARPIHPPNSGPSWRPRGVCVEDAVASLSLGDYFSSRTRGVSHASSSGSNASNSHLETASAGTPPPYSATESSTMESMESRMWSRVISTGSPVTTPSATEDQPPEGSESERTPNLAVPVRTKVLVVEDNIINRKILIKILKASLQHIEILEAEDGIDAVERFREFATPGIVLLDINMPRMDGYAAAVEMRIIEKQRAAELSGNPVSGYATPARRSKIIAVTALSGEDERHRGLVECGMDQWLTKPCHKSTLQKVVDDARQELAIWDP